MNPKYEAMKSVCPYLLLDCKVGKDGYSSLNVSTESIQSIYGFLCEELQKNSSLKKMKCPYSILNNTILIDNAKMCPVRPKEK